MPASAPRQCLHHGGDFEEVITLSPFIISEAANGQLVVLGPDQDAEHVMLRHGDSVNKVTMSLWRRETIGRQPATRQVARQASP